MKRKQAFSLIELVVSMAIISLISALVFGLFRMCSSVYASGNSRLSLQSELRRIAARFGIELRHSSFHTVSEAANVVTVPVDPGMSAETTQVRRDAISCAALLDPSLTTSYDDDGLPLWDNFTVFTCTQDSPNGRLYRYQLSHTPSVLQTPRFGANPIPAGYQVIPNAFAVTQSTRLMSKDIYHFQVDMDYANQNITIRLALRGDIGRTIEGRSTADIAETIFHFKPENTWPKM